MGEQVRVSLQFYGRVQGVGFRYQLSRFAKHYGVTGWVKNEYDGSVSAQMQGRETDVDMIMQRLMQDSYIDIQDIKRNQLPLEEAERGFQIRY